MTELSHSEAQAILEAIQRRRVYLAMRWHDEDLRLKALAAELSSKPRGKGGGRKGR